MSTLQFQIGDRVHACKSIYEGPDDHHPGGYLCRKGDLLIVRKVVPGSGRPLRVSHEDVLDMTFAVAPDEIGRAEDGRG